MNSAFLSLGSNIKNRMVFILNAILEIQKLENTGIKKISPFYKTSAYGNLNQDFFINMCLELETNLSPKKLMKDLKVIEQKVGRKPREKWGPREIDIDILFFNSFILDEPNLQIPHPDLHNRLFVLKPLSDIADELKHPLLMKNISQLLSEINDNSKIEILE